jgi:hypothetical protein
LVHPVLFPAITCSAPAEIQAQDAILLAAIHNGVIDTLLVILKGNNENMNRNTLLLIGGIVLLLASTPDAMADITTAQAECGSVSSADGSVAFTSSTAGSAGSAITSGGVGAITCTGFTVPTGATLIGLAVEVTDTAVDPLNSVSRITWNWTYSGEPLTPTPFASNSETSTGSSFGACTGSGTLLCNTSENFATIASYSNGQTTGNFTFDVAPSVTLGGGAGVNTDGSDSAQVAIQFTYTGTASTVPEPGYTAILLVGLAAVIFVARRKSATAA